MQDQRQCKICNKIKNCLNFKFSNGYYAKTCKLCKRHIEQPNKKCFTCHIEKPRSEFNGLNLTCVKCHSSEEKKLKNKILNKERQRRYTVKNKEKILEKSREYIKNNKEKRKETCKKYYLKNIEKIKIYSKNRPRKKYNINKEKRNLKYRERWNNDTIFKIKKLCSLLIRMALKKNNGSKNNSTFVKLSYTPQELKDHLEKQFEPWMNWNNWGIYNKNIWKDDNQNTWVWNIDHIIPQSKLPYASMEDENFKQCWALSNLRPYSAKQNILEGNRR